MIRSVFFRTGRQRFREALKMGVYDIRLDKTSRCRRVLPRGTAANNPFACLDSPFPLEKGARATHSGPCADPLPFVG